MMIAEAELRLPKGWLHLQRPLSRKVKFMNRTAILTLGLSLVPLLCRAAEPKAEQGKAIGESTRKLHSEESSNKAQRVCAEDRAALGKGNTTSAITLFSRAISLEPKNADAYLGALKLTGPTATATRRFLIMAELFASTRKMLVYTACRRLCFYPRPAAH